MYLRDFISRRTEAEIKNKETHSVQFTTIGKLEEEPLRESPPWPLLLHQRLHATLHHEKGVFHSWTWFMVVARCNLSIYYHYSILYDLTNTITVL
jgi:hypothetical protein